MKVSLELAADYFDVSQSLLRTRGSKYYKYVSNGMFDMDRYIVDQNKKMSIEDDEYDYEEDETKKPNSYIPIEEREPLTADFIMREYWRKQKTTHEIATQLNVPEYWVLREIKRLGLGKKERGIRHKSGRKGIVMSKEQRQKRQNQPHAKPVVQICPKTFITIKEYSSQGAVERYGFSRKNVRRAIKTCGLHKGYFWAFKELKEATIRAAKKREDSTKRKIQAYEYKRPTKQQLEKLYIIQNKTTRECADFFKCHPTTIALLAIRYGLKKRTEKISIDELKHLRLDMKLSVNEIAQKVGYTPKTIYTYLSRAGIRRDK